MRILIVRHGETEENIHQVLQGQSHNALSKNGKLQASALAKRLKGERIDGLYSSDLKRARETSEIISEATMLPIIYMEELRERNYGEFQGKAVKDYELAVSVSGLDNHLFRPTGGESYGELEQRVISAFQSIVVDHKNEVVMMVSHSGPIKILLKLLLSASHANLFPIEQQNACINIIDYFPEITKAEPVVLNCIKHLDHANIHGLGMYE